MTAHVSIFQSKEHRVIPAKKICSHNILLVMFISSYVQKIVAILESIVSISFCMVYPIDFRMIKLYLLPICWQSMEEVAFHFSLE